MKLSFALVFLVAVPTTFAAGPYQATGLKVGEVTDTSAIVWTRLTRREERNSSDAPKVEIVYDRKPGVSQRKSAVSAINYPDGVTVADIFQAVPGTDGDARVGYRIVGQDEWQWTNWQEVDGLRDFTQQFQLDSLQPNSRYEVLIASRAVSGETGQSLEGTFRTAPSRDQAARVVFTVSTGQGDNDQDRPDGFNIYPEMMKLEPSFFIHTGDIIYYDKMAKTVDLARWHWQRMYSWPTNVEFHRHVSSYFIKDDHDSWTNDCWPTMASPYMGDFTFRQGLKIFREQVPMGEKTYRTRRWGKDLQVWLVEGRDFRSANTEPDGPGKTIWGTQQKDWFKNSVAQSDATFKILVSPTPLVGPDRASKHDNHSNVDFKTEGDELRRFIADQKNMVVVCGDRHWQYMSIHPETGVREYSCGPASDVHAGGWKQSDYRDDYHRYLNVIGGFLSVTLESIDGNPTLAFRYHDVNGVVQYEDVLRP